MKLTKTIFLLLMFVCVVSLTGFAQEVKPEAGITPDQEGAVTLKRKSLKDLSQYSVSVKAGGVNIAEGIVSYKRGQGDWDLLLDGDELQSGDMVKTGANSRVEILLNPGSFLRLSSDTEMVFTDTALSTLKFEVLQGSAIVEIPMADWDKSTIATLSTPHAQFCILEGGIYRFDVDATKSLASVRRGKLIVPDPNLKPGKHTTWVSVTNGKSRALVPGTVIQKEKQVAIGAANLSVAALDKKAQDGFDIWSKDRANMMLAANKKLRNRALAQTMLANSWFTNSSSLHRWGGFWYYDPIQRCTVFVPYGSYGFSSPYGSSYGFCHCPSYPINRGHNGWNGGGWTGSGSGGSTGGGVSSGNSGSTGSSGVGRVSGGGQVGGDGGAGSGRTSGGGRGGNKANGN